MFGLAVALIAETLPDRSRRARSGLLQVLSTIGNLSAGLVQDASSTQLAAAGVIDAGDGWRWMFLVGALPALLVIFTMKYLREPEPWLRAKAEGRLPQGQHLDALSRSCLRDRRWRKNLLIGTLIASTGVIGLWAIGEYAVDLQANVFTSTSQEQKLRRRPRFRRAIDQRQDRCAYMLQMIGAAVGMWFMTKACIVLGRKPAFAIWYAAALVVTLYVYWKMKSPADAYWMMPLMGASSWACSRALRFTCRSSSPAACGARARRSATTSAGSPRPAGSLFSATLGDGRLRPVSARRCKERYAAMTMCAIFLIGLVDAAVRAGDEGQAAAGVNAGGDPWQAFASARRVEADMARRPQTPHRVVIVGGGFGGLNAAMALQALAGAASRSSIGGISTCSSRCCTRWPPAACRRRTSRRRCGGFSRRQTNCEVMLAEVVGFDLETRRVLHRRRRRAVTTR